MGWGHTGRPPALPHTQPRALGRAHTAQVPGPSPGLGGLTQKRTQTVSSAGGPLGRLAADPTPRSVEGRTSDSSFLIKIVMKKIGVSRASGGTQSFFTFRGCTFFLAPLWRRLGLLLAKDNLAFFRGSADCGDLPKMPFWGRFFFGRFLAAGSSGESRDSGVAPFICDSF